MKTRSSTAAENTTAYNMSVDDLDAGPYPEVPAHAVVTGASGFVGQRLVEMLLERGARKVIAMDIAPAPADAVQDTRVTYVQSDVRNADDLVQWTKGADCVFHIAAAVGPYHPKPLYEQVNYGGTVNVVSACKRNGVPKLVFSSSPSTRLTGDNVDGWSEQELPSIDEMQRDGDKFLQEYARTKAMGEQFAVNAGDDRLMVCAVAPHQVYGPRDNMFMPNLLEAAGTGRMRVFGNGQNRICFSHVDNYCHGLLLGAAALYKGSPALGQFYIVTDANTHRDRRGFCVFYECLDEAFVGMGFPSIYEKLSLPTWLLYPVAYLCLWITALTGIRLKLTPFAVTMLTIHRWFNVDRARRDLNYRPIRSFQQEWPRTIEWFRKNWLPAFQQEQKGITGLFRNTQNKIDVQAGKKNK